MEPNHVVLLKERTKQKNSLVFEKTSNSPYSAKMNWMFDQNSGNHTPERVTVLPRDPVVDCAALSHELQNRAWNNQNQCAKQNQDSFFMFLSRKTESEEHPPKPP